MRRPDHGIVKGLLLGTALSGLMIAGLHLLARPSPQSESMRKVFELLIKGYG